MAKQVREPIQVYLSTEERAELERAAKDLGVSRSEALRRGIAALGTHQLPGHLRDVAAAGLVTPAGIGPGEPPPSKPVATLAELLCELEEDRRDR